MCPEDLVAISEKETVNILQNPDSLTWSIDDSLLPIQSAPSSVSVMPPVKLQEEVEEKEKKGIGNFTWFLVILGVLIFMLPTIINILRIYI